MLKKRLIPKLLIKHQNIGVKSRPVLVTTRSFDSAIRVGSPISQAKIYEAQMADELVVLNIDGTPIGQDEMMLDLVERLASETFMPLAIGGGVRNIDDFGVLLEKGADKVTINSQAIGTPGLITEAAACYGSQCVVVSIDYRTDAAGQEYVARDHAKVLTDHKLLDWALEVTDLGAGELLICDADRDGTGNGLNLEAGRSIASSVPIPTILSGGCGLAEHFTQGFQYGMAEGVAAGTFFCFRDQNPIQTRAHIRNAGVLIRMGT